MISDYPYPRPIAEDTIEDGHLGGTHVDGDPDSYFPELWEWLVLTFKARSFMDVGCGVGHAMKFFHELGVMAEIWGIEGSEKVLAHHVLRTHAVQHDLREGPCKPSFLGQGWADIVWCCEVAEHLSADKSDNLVETLEYNTGKVLAFCAAPPGCGGYHHVNCQRPEYWQERLEAAGMHFEPELTEQARSLCPQNSWRISGNYFARSGLIFTT